MYNVHMYRKCTLYSIHIICLFSAIVNKGWLSLTMAPSIVEGGRGREKEREGGRGREKEREGESSPCFLAGHGPNQRHLCTHPPLHEVAGRWLDRVADVLQ